eukprot:scaffold214411_cov29-Prasinocladus_malaysianus.AAC.1
MIEIYKEAKEGKRETKERKRERSKRRNGVDTFEGTPTAQIAVHPLPLTAAWLTEHLDTMPEDTAAKIVDAM